MATRQEWLAHRAHQLSPGQVVGRWVFGAILFVSVMVLCYSSVTSVLQFRHEVAGYPLRAVLLPWTLITAIPMLMILATAWATWLALSQAAAGLAFRLSRLRRAVQLSIKRNDPRWHPKNLDAFGILAMLILMLASAIYVCISTVVEMYRQSPLAGALALVACLVFLGWACTGMIPQILEPSDIGKGLALIPPLRELPLPPRTPCPVCASGLRDRPLHRRFWRAIHPRLTRAAQWITARSAWAFYLYHHRDTANLTLVALLLLVLVGSSNSSAVDALLILSSFLAIAVLSRSLTSGPSLFDAYFERPSWKRVLAMIISMAGATLMLFNVRWIRNFLSAAQGEALKRAITLEPDQAVLFFVTLELLGLYCLANWCLTFFGYKLRWSTAVVARGALLPLLGLALGAISANWAWMATTSLLAWLTASSKPHREDWSKAKQSGFLPCNAITNHSSAVATFAPHNRTTGASRLKRVIVEAPTSSYSHKL